MKYFHIYKTTGTALWAMPLYKYSTGIMFLYGTYSSVFKETASGEWNDDSDIDLSLIPEKQQHDVIEIIFTNSSIFKYYNA